MDSKIVIINGSMSLMSTTFTLLRHIESYLNLNNVSTEIISVRDINLPLFNPDIEIPNDLKTELKVFSDVDGLILASPEYHSSCTGALKNVLDYLSVKDIQHKPVGLVATSGGSKGGINTLNCMRLISTSLKADTIIEQIALSEKEIELLDKGSTELQGYIHYFGKGILRSLGNLSKN